MRRCPDCGRSFEEPRRLCPDDGEVLLREGGPDASSGKVLEGRYRLGLLIGEGGMGRVYEAVRLDSGETVAVKLLRPEVASPRVRRRFEREAEAMAALRHPGVVRLVEFGHSSDGTAYIVMERLRGPTLADLRRAGKLGSPDEAVAAVRGVCEVVAAAHAAGIVHRDLKPSNVVLHRGCDGQSTVKVLDFGIARILDRAGEHLTRSGDMLGTLAYMAPEQGFGRAVTPAADVYSLGVMLFEALAGRVPHDIRSPAEFLRRQAGTPAPALSSFREDISPALDDIVGRCLARRPESRYPDAAALARELEGVPLRREDADEQPTAMRLVRVNPSRWVGAVLDDCYELHDWLSSGRFGSNVYLATHLRTMARVAVRLWETRARSARDRVIEAFRSEALAMGVRHPNLIAILDLGFPEEGVYVVTEFVESFSLRDLLAAKGPLPWATAAPLAQGAAEALSALHDKGIYSGGLSPETTRVTGELARPERLLLSPFGLTSRRQIESLLGGPGEAVATDRALDYLAPEQRDGAPPDAGSDFYSLGLVLLEMMTGRAPSELQATVSTPRSGSGVLALPDELTDGWKRLFQGALAAEPSRRLRNAGAFAAGLKQAAGKRARGQVRSPRNRDGGRGQVSKC